MKIRVVMHVEVPLFQEEPDPDPESTALLDAEYGPQPKLTPDDVARVLAMMLSAQNGSAFEAIAIEEGMFSHIASVALVSAERLPDADSPANDR
jgi:hypothetical protein